MNHDFYVSKQWKAKRLAILHRDKFLCIECKKYGRRREATTVHHIEPIETRPELALKSDNLESLCDKCHNKKHPEKGGRHRF